ncbi:hypothetical protein WA158_006004 [Blastocystis sp. Blastoise]
MVNIVPLLPSISYHCWSPDRTLIAICPNNNEVWIYEVHGSMDPQKWTKRDVIPAHDMKITGLDWSATNGKILTCSEDCTANVWKYENNKWICEPSVLNINTAALCCAWSPNGQKFAVGYNGKEVCICYYDSTQNLWARAIELKKKDKKDKKDAKEGESKKKNKASSVLCVTWHPSNQLVAYGSVSGVVRIANAYIPSLDGNAQYSPIATPANELLTVYVSSENNDSIEAICFNNTVLTWTCHDSTLNVMTFEGNQQRTQMIYCPSLPLTSLLFINPTVILASGYDYIPYVFGLVNNIWEYIGTIDRCPPPPPAPRAKSPTEGSSIFQRSKLFQNRLIEPKQTVDPDAYKHHKNTIISMYPVFGDNISVTNVSTASLDGRVVLWDIKKNCAIFKKIHI